MTALVTILTRTDGRAAGKTYSAAGKTVANHTGRYHAETLSLDGDPVAVLTGYQSLVERLTPDQSVILGHAPAAGGAPYRILPARKLPDEGRGLHLINGVPCLARLKGNFEPSRLLLLDFDPDDAMPEAWRGLDEAGRWSLLLEAVPEFAGAARLTIPSGSGRVLGADGLPIKTGPGGSHSYIVLDRDVNSGELDDMRTRLEVRLWARGLGFTKTSASGAQLRRCLVDSSVWVSGRELFDAPPCVVAPLALGPSVAVLVQGGAARPIETLDDSDVELYRQRTGARVVTAERTTDGERTGAGAGKAKGQGSKVARLAIQDCSTLRMDTRIETPDGVITVRQFLESGAEKVRCQATFRESTSWAGILRRVGQSAILHDVGTNTTYRLSDTGEVAGALQKAIKSAIDQGTARAVLARHLWRTPVQMRAADLIAAISANSSSIEPGDLIAFADWMASQRADDALQAVQVNAAGLPEWVQFHLADDMQAIYQQVRAMPGIHFIKAPHSSGKTQSLLRPIALDNDDVVAIAPRISLVADLCSRMGLDSYQDRADTSRLGICLNSIINDRFDKPINNARVVLIDEIAKCIKECHTSKSTLGKDARKTWNKLLGMMRQAQLVIGVDADLSNHEVTMLAELGLPLHLWVIEESKRDLTAHFDRVSNIIEDFKQTIATGSRCLLVCDTAQRVAELASWIRSEFPSKSVVEIHAKKGSATTGRGDVKALLKNIDQGVTGVDVLLMSPAVESGLSLNVKHFDRHFAIYSGTIEPSAFNQMLLRDRTATEWMIGIQGNGKRDLPDDYQNAVNNLDAAQRLTAECLTDAGLGSFVSVRPRTAYDEHCCRVQMAANRARKNYSSSLFALLEHRGWTVESRWRDESDAGRMVAEQAAMLHEADATAAIVTAAILSDDDAHALRQRHAITPADSASLARFDVAEAVAVAVDAVGSADVEHWQDGRLVGQRALFDGLTDAGVTQADVKDALNSTPQALRSFTTVRNRGARALFDALGVDPMTGAGTITQASALKAFNDLKSGGLAGVLEHAGICRFDRQIDAKNAVRWAGDALARFGLWLEVSKHEGAGGSKGRVYRLARGAKITRSKRTGLDRFKLPGLDLMRLFHSRERVTPVPLIDRETSAVTQAAWASGA